MRMIHTTILVDDGRNVVSVRRDAAVLGIGIEDGRTCVWTHGGSVAAGCEARVFWVLRAGERSPSFADIYIGTVQKKDGTVRHVVEEFAPREVPQPLPPTLAERIVSRWPRFHVDDVPVVMEIIDEERAKDRWG